MAFPKRKIFIVVIFSLSILIYVGYGFSKPDEMYHIFIGTHEDDFNEDDKASASGDAIQGDVFVYINNNCISRYGGYGTSIQINQWLKKGKNEYSFTGTSSEKIFIKIAKWNTSGKGFKLLARNSFGPGIIKTIGNFSADIDYSLLLFQSAIPTSQSVVERELKETISQIKIMFDQKDKAGLYETFLFCRSQWQPVAYGVEWAKSEEMFKKKLFTQYIRGQKRIVSFKPDELNFIFGPNSIYIYSGITENQTPQEDYLFRMEKKDKSEFTMPAIKLVKLNSKWLVWE